MKNEEGEDKPDLSNFYTQSFKTNYFEKTGPNNIYPSSAFPEHLYILPIDLEHCSIDNRYSAICIMD